MDEAAPLPPPWRFSTDDLPEKQRFGVLNELFGDAFLCDMNPHEPSGLSSHVKGWVLTQDDLITTVGQGADMTFVRSPRHTRQRDDVTVAITLSGRIGVTQCRSEFVVHPGEAFVSLGDEPATARMFPGEIHRDITLVLPRAAFAAAGIDRDRLLRSVIPRNDPALQMLISYIGGLAALTHPLWPQSTITLSNHICDLAALAMGARPDEAQCGLRAARLKAIKADIVARISECDISLEETARRHGISAVYVRKLFEIEGMSFSAFVLSQRLHHARRMLTSPRHGGMMISTIAYECGFADLSYFNRAFRRCYDMTPSEVRAGRPRRMAEPQLR